MKWTKDWPTKSGMYWFYGWRYGKYTRLDGKEEQPQLKVVTVKTIGADKNQVIYILDGAFWYKSEKGLGLFSVIELPELPNLEEL